MAWIDEDIKKLITHNATLHFINSVRGTGKTESLKARTIYRAIKRHKCTIWVRAFRDEIKETKETFFKSSLIKRIAKQHKSLKLDGLEFRVLGNRGQYRNTAKKGDKWHTIVRFIRLGQALATKSSDEDDYDTMVFDEYCLPYNKIRMYRGNMVKDFLDLLVSMKRYKKFKVFLLGNDETANNNFLNFWKIQPLPKGTTGFKKYNHNRIIVYQLSHQLTPDNEQVKQAQQEYAEIFEGTSYYDYYFNGQPKTLNKGKYEIIKLSPKNYYCGFDYNGLFSIYKYKDGLYINDKIDTSQMVYVNEHKHYKQQCLIQSTDKPFIKNIIRHYKLNNITYKDELVQERFIQMLAKLNIA